MIKMEELRRTFEALGFVNVVSYINSGNLAFDTRKASATALAAKIEKAIEKDFGKTVKVMVRPQSDIEGVLADNPFDGEYANHKEMHVLFMKEEMSADKKEQLYAAQTADERFAVHGREIYCHLRMGVANSLLGKGFIEKKLKLSVTARNWRTVEQLTKL